MPITLTKPMSAPKGGGIKLTPSVAGAPTLDQVKKFATKPVSAPNLGDRLATDFSKRSQTILDISADPNRNTVSKVLRTAGQFAGAVTDVATEGIKSLGSLFGGNQPLNIKQEKMKSLSPGANLPTPVEALSNTNLFKGAAGNVVPGVGGTSNYVQNDTSKLENTLEDVAAGGEIAGTIATADIVPKTGITKIGEIPGAVKNTVSDFINSTKKLDTKLGEIRGPLPKKLEDLVNETSGVADKKARISNLEKTGALDKNGKPIGGSRESLFGGIKTSANPKDLARAKSVEGIVIPGASPVKNLTNLNREISRISENEITPILEKAGSVSPISEKTPGWNKITQRLSDIEKPDIIKADPTLDKTYDLVRQRMIDQIQKQPPTFKGLWDARKAFDKVVEDQFGDAAFNSEKNTAIKRAISDMRREINNIIGDKVPEYKSMLDKLSDMYDARYNIAENFQNILDKGGWARFKTLSPKKAAILKWGGATVGTLLTGKALKDFFTGK